MEPVEARELVNEIIEEVALLLGGVEAMHPIEDEVVWRLARGLGTLRRRFLRKIEETELRVAAEFAALTSIRPHPAIEQLLRELRLEAEGHPAAGA